MSDDEANKAQSETKNVLDNAFDMRNTLRNQKLTNQVSKDDKKAFKEKGTRILHDG